MSLKLEEPHLLEVETPDIVEVRTYISTLALKISVELMCSGLLRHCLIHSYLHLALQSGDIRSLLLHECEVLRLLSELRAV